MFLENQTECFILLFKNALPSRVFFELMMNKTPVHCFIWLCIQSAFELMNKTTPSRALFYLVVLVQHLNSTRMIGGSGMKWNRAP